MIVQGWVRAVEGDAIEASLPGARVGDTVWIEAIGRYGTVRRVRRDGVGIAAHAGAAGIAAGSAVRIVEGALPIGVGLLGRAVDGCGAPLDGKPPPQCLRRPPTLAPPSPAERRPIADPLWTGVRAIDGCMTIGQGARVGIFGVPGCGKSTLLESIARYVEADAVIVAAIGERGREAERWIAGCDARTTVVCATSDRPAAERLAATRYALAHAAHLRDRGLAVVVILDSLARVGYALREVAVAAGESVGRGGYPASVVAELARLVEVAGPTRAGTVTLLATVLFDGDERDPISEAARALLDGHLVLDAARARRGAFPAIDLLASNSRTMAAVVDATHARHAAALRRAVGWLEETRDARALGVLDDEAGRTFRMAEPAIEAFLAQGARPCDRRATLAALAELADTLEEPYEHR